MTSTCYDNEPSAALHGPAIDHPVVRAYANYQLDLIGHYVPTTPRTRVLEIGCGAGRFSAPLSQRCQVLGIDASAANLSRNPLAHKALMDVCHLELEDNSFDWVFCHNVLHHIVDENQALREMARVSRDYVVVVEPNRYHPLNWVTGLLTADERRCMVYSPSYLARMMEANGLCVQVRLAHGLLPASRVPPALGPLWRLTAGRQPFGLDAVIIARVAQAG